MKEAVKKKQKRKYYLGDGLGVTIDKNMDPHMLDDLPWFKAKQERFAEFWKTCSLEGLPEEWKKGFEEMQRRLNAADKK